MRLELSKEALQSLLNIEDPEFTISLSNDAKALVHNAVDTALKRLTKESIETRVEKYLREIIGEDQTRTMIREIIRDDPNDEFKYDGIRARRDKIVIEEFDKVLQQKISFYLDDNNLKLMINRQIRAILSDYFTAQNAKELPPDTQKG